MRLRIWILMVIATIALVGFFVINRSEEIGYDYGRNSNPVRVQVHVPIIEDEMKRVYTLDSFVANHWEVGTPSYEDGQPVHYSKNVTPIDALQKVEEKDLFKMRIQGDQYHQLYIKSTIYDMKRSSREGVLTVGQSGTDLRLNESGIDSVATSWGLHYLVRDQSILRREHSD